MDAEVRADAASIDAAIDGGAPDAGPDDAGAPDAGSPDDAGPPDGGPSDAGPIDGAIACATDCSELTDACHDGVCDRSTGTCTAVSAPDGSSCDDGAACTSGDACAAGVCSGTAVDCSAMSDACHTGVCDPATGACTRTTAADGTPCSDASPCTTDDACTAGACAGTAVDCSAMSDACHTGICDPATGACTRTTAADGTPCSDGIACTTGDVCTAGACGGSPVVCSGTVCMPSSCGPLGTCVSSPAPNGTPCTFDANLCTRDECSSGTCGGRLVCRPPSDFMPFGATTNTIVRGATSTTLTEDTCPIGSALVGVEARIGAGVTYLGTVRGVCRSLSIMGSGAGPYTFVDEGPTTALPDRGTMGTGSYIAALCPAGRIMVGFTGRSGGAIDALSVRCAPLSIVATPTEWTVSVLAPSVAGTVGGTGGVAFPATDCPVGQVATRVRVHSGDFVNGFGLGCQVPRLSYAATFASAGTTTQHGGTGGTAFNDACPAGTAIVRYDGWVASAGFLSLIRASCARIEVVGPVASPSILQRNFATPITTPDRGTPGASTFSAVCPVGSVAAGFSGREGTLLDQVTFRCSALSASGTSVVVSPPSNRMTVGTSGGGTAFAPADCPAGSFATRNIGRSGTFLDALAMGCSRATW